MQKQTDKKKTLLIVILIIAAIGVILTFAFPRKESGSESTAGIKISEDAVAWNNELEDASNGQQGIKIPGYGEITVLAGETTWGITLLNPEGNDCYFQYSVTIDDEETPVYESDLIEPGMAITGFEVTEPLEAGDYEIHLNISAYAMDDELTVLNGADVKAVLHVV